MSTSETFDSLECKVCYEPFDDKDEAHLPRILPCNVHSLCTACIQDLLDKFPEKTTFTCPFENIDFALPNRIIEDFPVNSDLLVVLQMLKNDELGRSDDTPDDHKCPKHNLILESICFDCKIPICSHCETDEHERHFYKDKEDAEAYLKKAEGNQFECLEEYNQLKDEEDEVIEETKKDMKTYIAMNFDEMIDFLKKKKDEALGKVDTFVDGKVRTCSQIDKSVKEELQKLQKSSKKIQEMGEDVSYEDIIAKYSGSDDEEKKAFHAYCDMISGMKNLEKKALEDVIEKRRQENVKISQILASIKCTFDDVAMEMLRQANFVEFEDPSLEKEIVKETRKPKNEHWHENTQTRRPGKYREGSRQGDEQLDGELLFSRLSQFDEENDSDNEDRVLEILKRLFKSKWGIEWKEIDGNSMIIDASSNFVNEEEISEIASFFKSLKKRGQVMSILTERTIGIAGCFHIQTDDGLKKFRKILSYLNSLREIQVTLKECLKVSEEGFLKLGAGFSKLKKVRKLSIKFHRCKTLVVVFPNDQICSTSRLEHFVLSFSKCHELTEDHLRSMLESISEISSRVKFDLEILGCRRIGKSCESAIKRINGDVHRIHIE